MIEENIKAQLIEFVKSNNGIDSPLGKMEFTNSNIIGEGGNGLVYFCLLYTSPSPRDLSTSRMPSSA